MSVNIRSFQEVERRLANLTSKNEDVSKKVGTTLKVSNKMNSFFNSLIINLKDLLKSQSDISLWFFDEDIPTLTNKPTSDWSTSDYSNHYGDIFYSKTKGRIYEFNNSVWSELNDESLRKAMALTDSQLETNDNERKVFVSIPSPPYESGDWYIHDDGLLYICQVGRNEGKYVETDFISSVDYAGAVAEKTGNQTIITKGTVITETAEAVTYLDKATNTTSAISGDSIRTGSITSNNYVKNTKGTRINLNDGTIDSKNFKVDEYGNMSCSNANINGDLIVAGRGVLSNLQFIATGLSEISGDTKNAGEYLWLGFMPDYGAPADKYDLFIDISVPSNFTITSAYLTLRHIPTKTYMQDGTTVYGYVRNVKAYIADVSGTAYVEGGERSEYKAQLEGIYYNEISNCFNNSNNNFTATVPSANNLKVTEVTSKDIASQIKKNCRIKIATTNSIPAAAKDCIEQTGFVWAAINIYGYLQLS